MGHNVSMLRKLLFMLVAVLSFTCLQAQEKVITGSVTDANDGMGIPGASIVVKGTTNGTTTDLDGHYSLKASANSTLVISFIGYKTQEILVGDQSQINIVLGVETENLSEVMVIGYGQVKKEDATGSLTAISSDDFNKGAISSPQDLLVGKTSGVQITTASGEPGSSATIRIRGGASMSANNDPLFVIDGVPISSDGINGISNPLATINPEDIETFTVLKDASSTAIYGSRASNGVIIITTKRGKEGQPLTVNYSSKVSVSNTAKRLDVYNASQYRKLITDTYGSESKEAAALGTANTDWQDEIYRTAIGTDHNLSFSGGLKNLPYRLSLGYNYQDGVLKTSNIQRKSVNLSVTPKFFDNHLKTTLNVKGALVNNTFANSDAVGAAIGFDPTHPIKSGTQKWGNYWQWVNNKGVPIKFTPNNPMALLEQRDDKSDVYRGIVNLKLDYKLHFLPEVSAVVNMGYDVSDSDGERISSPDAAWLYQTEEIRGEYHSYDQKKENKLLDTYLQYSKNFGDHDINVMGGYSWQHFHNEGHEYTNDYYKKGTPSKDLDFASEHYLVSFYGRMNYSYKNRYLLTGTVRRDGTSRFNPDGGNQWGTFPSAAFAWKINQEDFMKDSNLFSELKLRLGWGITGQQDVTGDSYVGYPTYTLSDNGAQYVFGDQWMQTYRPDGYDPNLKWEETTSSNIGIDFSILNSRISGSVDYYYRKTKDLINKVTIAAGTNLSDRIISNVGNLENEGIELNLVGRPIVSKDLFWEIGANATYNKNKITKLTTVNDPSYVGVPSGDLGSARYIQIQSVGHSLNTFYVYEQVYDKAGKPLDGVYVDQNNDGIINSKDRIHYGNSTPKVMVGLNTTVKYKAWDLSLNGRFQFGAKIYNGIQKDNANWVNIYNPTTTSLSNRLVSAEETQFTKTDEKRVYSSHWIESADFFRLDNITIGCNLDSILGYEKTKLRVYLTGQNLFVISPYSGLDPEIFTGIDNSMFPRPTTVMLGLNLGF